MTINSDRVEINSGRVGINSGRVEINSGRVGINSGRVGINSGRGVVDGMVSMGEQLGRWMVGGRSKNVGARKFG